jgi:phosphoribosylaminoimidazole carboxylase PurE protein
VYITVAGMSNALSGVVDCNTYNPVISCPPLNKDNIQMDIWSSLRTPSDVCPSIILNPKNAALHAVKILSMKNYDLKKSIIELQNINQNNIIESSENITKG